MPNIGRFGALVLKRVLGTTQWVTRSKWLCRKPERERRRSTSLRQELGILPPEIGWLSNLSRLNLSGNQLTELPAEIGQLANLTVLQLRACVRR